MRTDLQLDHLVVGARTLNEGVGWVAERLGADIGPGGRHEAMGTHNRVMQIGGGAYLEVIAIDPGAVAPDRPRWFDLDNPYVAGSLGAGPRLLTWVARVPASARLADIPLTAEWGEAIAMSRGALHWHITVPTDGRLPAGGFLPTLLEWHCDPPADSMVDSGCRLRHIVLRHPAGGWLRRRLASIGAAGLVDVADADATGARIEAEFDTPIGRIVV